MNYLLNKPVGALAASLLLVTALAACGSTAEPQSAEQKSSGEMLEELQDPGQYVSVFCALLKTGRSSHPATPPVAQCNEDLDTDVDKKGVVVAFEDTAAHLIENNLDFNEETVFSPMQSLADAYSETGAELLAPYEWYLIFFKDECNYVWEVKPSTLSKLADQEVTLKEAMREVDITADKFCP